jgi:hypothetical protein
MICRWHCVFGLSIIQYSCIYARAMPCKMHFRKSSNKQVDTASQAQPEKVHLAKCVGLGQFKRQFAAVFELEQFCDRTKSGTSPHCVN